MHAPHSCTTVKAQQARFKKANPETCKQTRHLHLHGTAHAMARVMMHAMSEACTHPAQRACHGTAACTGAVVQTSCVCARAMRARAR